jgi:hypothetical protein
MKEIGNNALEPMRASSCNAPKDVTFRVSARNAGGLVEITPLMSFKHLRILNSASKCL